LDDQRLDIVRDAQAISWDHAAAADCWVKIGGKLRIWQYARGERLRIRDTRFQARSLQIGIIENRDSGYGSHIERLYGLRWKAIGQIDALGQWSRSVCRIAGTAGDEWRRDADRNDNPGGMVKMTPTHRG
jgi:hypothetical protein